MITSLDCVPLLSRTCGNIFSEFLMPMSKLRMICIGLGVEQGNWVWAPRLNLLRCWLMLVLSRRAPHFTWGTMSQPTRSSETSVRRGSVSMHNLPMFSRLPKIWICCALRFIKPNTPISVATYSATRAAYGRYSLRLCSHLLMNP
ncbi:hypothetical protein D3C78_1357880 [compost metagenome]